MPDQPETKLTLELLVAATEKEVQNYLQLGFHAVTLPEVLSLQGDVRRTEGRAEGVHS